MAEKKKFGYGERFAHVTLSDQMYFTLYAAPGGVAAEVLKYIGKDEVSDGKYERQFGVWKTVGDKHVCYGIIKVIQPRGEFLELPLNLVISDSVPDGSGVLTLADVTDRKITGTFSGKELKLDTLAIGAIKSNSKERKEEDITPLQQQVRHVATSILATWIIQGRPWVEELRKVLAKGQGSASKKRRERSRRSSHERSSSSYLFC